MKALFVGLVVAGVVIAAGAVVLVAANDDEEPPPVVRGVPVARVLADAPRFSGERVTVTGRIDVLTDGAMTLGEEDLIVLPADPDLRPLERQGFNVGDRVHATGVVRIVDARSAVRRLEDRSLLPSQFQGFERQPVLFAEQVRPA